MTLNRRQGLSNTPIGPADGHLFSCTELTFKPPRLTRAIVKAHLGERLMENPKTATMRTVQETFAAWKTVNDRITATEGALRLEAASRDDSPSGLNTELQALRLESERLLLIAQRALLTIKTPRSSSGDSTWG